MRRLSKVTIILLVNVALLVFFVLSFGREYLRNLEVEREIETMTAEHERLEAEKLESLALINDLSSEYYVEGHARTKEGLGRPGETLVIVDDGQAAAATMVDDDDRPSLSNPALWLLYFFDREKFAELKSGL